MTRTASEMVFTCEIAKVDDFGTAYIRLDGEVIRARSTVRVLPSQVGAEGVVVLECGDSTRPIILGVIQNSLSPVHLESDTEIALRCGEASITLMSSGQVVIRGSHVSSSAKGIHRIRGGAVKIN